MPTVIELFKIENGIQVTDWKLTEESDCENTLPVLRPSHSFQSVIAGYIASSRVPASRIYPADSLMVSTDGEGSHSYSYVIPYPFLPNSNVAVLLPRVDMSLQTKLFYSLAITQSRWRFSYGRKPKGARFELLALPVVPKWVEIAELPKLEKEFDGLEKLSNSNIVAKKGNLPAIKNLFNIRYGNSYELNRLKPDPHGIAFVSRTRRNNGISGRVARTQDEPTPPGCITVALGGTNVLEAFLQIEPTYQGRDVAILTAKSEMTVTEKLWYVTAIRQHRFRFGFDRQANRQLPELTVPECPKSLL